MTLTTIAFFIIFALAYRWFLSPNQRGWVLLIASEIFVFWISPALSIPYLDIGLATVTIALTVLVWWVTQSRTASLTTDDKITLVLTIGVVLFLATLRYLLPSWRGLTPALSVWPLLLALVGFGGVLFVTLVITRRFVKPVSAVWLLIALIVLLFIMLKTEPLAEALVTVLHQLTLPEDILPAPLIWIGFSYVAFRWLHILFDWRAGQLPVVSLRETLTYVLFFPAFLAGPIDRVESFSADYRTLPALSVPETTRLLDGGERLLLGILKKFVIADSLTLLALSPATAQHFTSPARGWLLLYIYGIRLFLDFSGYTDIAIGVGILLGIRLPENFTRPYRKANIAAFWRSWHITLSNWVRFYIFAPLSRTLLRRHWPPLLVVFVAQVFSMLIIGLWHGFTWSFAVWGLWHGLGLFMHKVWSDRTRRVYLRLRQKPRLQKVWSVVGWFLTLQFVMLGWVWFVLPDVEQAAQVLLKLFGVGW
ncbi:MBOAT family O-acyltransferase [Chloroflexota bacterium]